MITFTSYPVYSRTHLVSSRAGFDTVEEENCPASNQTSISSTSGAHSIFSVPAMVSNTRSNDDDDDDCGGGGG